MNESLSDILERNADNFHCVVSLGDEKIAPVDLSSANSKFSFEIFSQPLKLNSFIESQMNEQGVKYLWGGYCEDRAMYRRSELFDGEEEPRSLHLGIDIWGPAGTPVYAPADGTVHSFAFNNNHGDYGATIILEHKIGNRRFFILYGHLALRDLDGLEIGKQINKGSLFAHFGDYSENGNWPPHLHFQIIEDMGEWKGDYPGVCQPSSGDTYKTNSPDPSIFFPIVKT